MHRTLAVGVAKCAECCRRCCGNLRIQRLISTRFETVQLCRASIDSLRYASLAHRYHVRESRLTDIEKVSSAAVGARWQWVIHRFDSPLMQTQHDFAGFVPEPDFLRVAAHLRAEQSLVVPRPHLSLLITGGDNQIIAVPVPR